MDGFGESTKSNLIIMFWVFLGALGVLVPSTLAVTELTTKNCPLAYNITDYNITSGSQATVDMFYGGLYSEADKAALQQSFAQGDSATIGSYVTNAHLLNPFIIIAVAFVLTYLIAVCCCVFEKSCPPCESWKRDFSTNPYTKRELKCTAVFALFFSFSILVVGIVGLVFYPNLQKKVAMIKCSLFYTVDVAMNGDVNRNWGGFSQITAQSSNISGLLALAGTSITATFGAANPLQASLDALRQQNSNIYKNNYQSTVASPSHTPAPPVTPLFIHAGLGPTSNANTMTGDIEAGIAVTEQVTDQATKVFNSAVLLSSSISGIQAKYGKSIQVMNSNNANLAASVGSVSQFSEEVLDGFFVKLVYLIQGILGVVILCSILVFLGVLGTNYFEIYGCKACVHLGWIFYGLMYLGIVALSFIFFSVGGVSYSFCQFYGGVVQSQVGLAAFSASLKATAFNRIFQTLSPCFFGSGSIAATFAVTNETVTVNQLFTEINTYMNMQDSSKSTYVNLNLSTDRISGWMDAMEKYRTGVYVDVDTSIVTEENPYVALGGMNALTNKAASSPHPTCTSDYWVFDKANCTHNATEAVYAATLTSGTSFVSTGFMCVSFNEKFSSSSLNIWSESDIMSRYITRRYCQNDTQTFDSLMPYVSALIAYRDSRINLYQNLKEQLSSLLAANTALNAQVVAFTTSLISFNVDTASLNSLMTSSVNGMEKTFNCSVVADNLRLIYNLFCVDFVYRAVQLGVCCVILLGMMVGGVLTGSVFGVRYNRIEKTPHVYREDSATNDELTSSKRDQQEEEPDSSDTSSSEDENK